MDRQTPSAQALVLRKPRPPLGVAATILLMVVLCAPLAWHADRLIARHGLAARLADLPPLELLAAFCLLVLPFVALRLLRVRWQAER